MNNKEIIQNNILIAKFMGVRPRLIAPDMYCIFASKTIEAIHDTPDECWKDVGINTFSFHKSWDELMPVVEECKKRYECFGYDDERREYIESEIFNLDNMMSEFLNNNIGAIYERVVEFIKYHNDSVDKYVDEVLEA